jgi:hypothetical protein
MEQNDSMPGQIFLDNGVFIDVKFKLADLCGLQRYHHLVIFAQSA